MVDEVIEPYLLQEGMVARTPRGRMLTDAGFRYLGLSLPVNRQIESMDGADD